MGPNTTKTRAARAADWLPYTRSSSSTWVSRVLRKENIQALRHHDWFLTLASNISKDSVQSKMLVKFYLFMRDFIPLRLTGRFAHIDGRDMMHQLLSHANESTMSRHKVTKHTKIVFAKLGQWMGNSKTWQEALQKARAEVNSGKEKAGKKLLTSKAPGLHSPAGLIAVLIIAHPDPESKFRSLVGRLGIEWMMTQDRRKLNVYEGFWRRINSKNLHTVFADTYDKNRKAKVTMLVDYARLFDADFRNCRKDIRPYLPAEFAKELTPPVELASNIEDTDIIEIDGDELDGYKISSEGGNHVPDTVQAMPSDIGKSPFAQLPKITAAKALRLRRCFGTTGDDPRDLEVWLISQLEKPEKILLAWCSY